MTTLINDRAERMKRAAEKERLVLSFLFDEVWATAKTLQQLLGLATHVPVNRLLRKMENKGLVKPHKVSLGGPDTNLWGITANGLAMSVEPEKVADALSRSTFEPSKVSVSHVNHQTKLQIARIEAERAGWTDWVRGERMGGDISKRPDAVAIDPNGRRIAIEVELSFKSKKRYQQVIGEYAYLCAVKKAYKGVYYICEDDSAVRFKNLFHSIKTGYYKDDSGQRGSLEIKENILALFKFYDISQWPNGERL